MEKLAFPPTGRTSRSQVRPRGQRIVALMQSIDRFRNDVRTHQRTLLMDVLGNKNNEAVLGANFAFLLYYL